MFTQSRARRARIFTGISALLAGLAWLAKDIGSRISPDPDYWNCNSSYDYVLNGVDTIAFIALALVLLGIRELFRSSIGDKGALLGAMAATGFAVAGLANLLEHCAALDALGFAYVIGLTFGMLLVMGFTLTLTRAPLARWVVWLLLIGTVAGMLLFNQGGLFAFGTAWVLLGVALIQKSDEPGGEVSLQSE